MAAKNNIGRLPPVTLTIPPGTRVRDLAARLARAGFAVEAEVGTEIGDQPRRTLDVSWQDAPEPCLPEVVQVQAAGTTLMRVRYQKRGVHYHCRVFTAPDGGTFANNGELVFDATEWPDIPMLMRAEFIQESS